ncbi:MAG: hypothetical protein ACK4UJ_06900 [Leptonema sp. (in: bacteria)]
MKVNFLLAILLGSLIGIGVLIFQFDHKKFCEDIKFSSLTLIDTPYEISIKSKNNHVLISFQNQEFVASSFIKNFYNSINPLCSDSSYDYKSEFFSETFCFTLSKTQNLQICRGKKLQKGYPVILKRENQIPSKMYIIESYSWDRVEDSIKNFNENDIKNFLNPLVDKRILKLPEKSFVSSIQIQKDKETLSFLKKNQEWFYNEKKINTPLISSFINQILMLEYNLDPFYIPTNKNNLKELLSINFGIDFEKWKYSIFQKKEFKLKFYLNNEHFIVALDEKDYLLDNSIQESLLKNIEKLKAEIHQIK